MALEIDGQTVNSVTLDGVPLSGVQLDGTTVWSGSIASTLISLDDGSTTIYLPGGLQWTDEFTWSTVEQSLEHSLDGALHVQQGEKQAGRTITLVGGTGGAWASRQQILDLYEMSNVPDLTMTLTLWGRVFSVMFRRPAIEAEEIMRYANPGIDQSYSLTVNLFEVVV